MRAARLTLTLAVFVGTLAAPVARAGAAQRQVEVTTWHATPDLSVAYRGTGALLVHPGLAARLTWNLRQRDVIVTRRKTRHRTRTWFAGPELGASAHIFNNTLVTAQGVAGTRLTRSSGITTGWSVGLGPNRAFLNHPTWATDGPGEAHRVWFRGQWSAAATLSWELGYDLQRFRALRGRRPVPAQPVQWYLRPSLTVLTPWLDVQAPVAYVDIGVRAPLSAWQGKR
jgi:hypothetical protein